MPTPPATVSAPVVELVDAAVFDRETFDLNKADPATSNICVGLVVPIPTLPLKFARHPVSCPAIDVFCSICTSPDITALPTRSNLLLLPRSIW